MALLDDSIGGRGENLGCSTWRWLGKFPISLMKHWMASFHEESMRPKST
jgi:hypothetical protein